MSYTPTTWNTGDTITPSALNKIEQGIANAGSALIVQTLNTGGVETMDKTVQEIYDAMSSGTPVYIKWAYGTFADDYISHTHLAPIIKIFAYNYAGDIRVVASWAMLCNPSTGTGVSMFAPSLALFSASGANDYPVFYRTVNINDSSLTSSETII